MTAYPSKNFGVIDGTYANSQDTKNFMTPQPKT
jgi:hypothetical protein